jgi:hypothetical protein
MRLEKSVAEESDEYAVKKEILAAQKDVDRLDKVYKGLKFMDRLPKLLIVIDSKVEKNAIKEANKVGVPVVALVDTNCDPTLITYPVPANDDSIKSITLLMELFADAVAAGSRATRLVGIRKQYYNDLEERRLDAQKRKAAKIAMHEEEVQKLKMMKQSVAGDIKKKVVKPKSKKKSASKKVVKKSLPIESLKLSARLVNALKSAGFNTVDEVAKLSKPELLVIKGIGAKGADDILSATSKK